MDFKFPDNLPWMNDRIILATLTGSHAYGTNTETSDMDYKAVCIPPEEYYFGLQTFNEYNNTGGKNWKNTADDVDMSVMHINKFVKDCMLGIPNNIEILFTSFTCIKKYDTFGIELISHRHDFLSKAIKAKFSGYGHQQKKLLITKKSNGTGRQDLVEKFGYDTKLAMHSVRLFASAIEILYTGDFHTFRPEREELVAIRNGKYTLEQILKIIEDLDKELEELYITSDKVPYSPDFNKINGWLIDLNKRALEEMR